MKLKNLLLPLFAVLTIFAMGSCKPKADNTPTVKTTIKLSQVSVELEEGKSIKLNATLNPSDAKEAITWESSNKEIATVKNDGTVTAVKAGEATITAKLANGNSATCKVNVKAPKKVEPTPAPNPDQGGDKKKPDEGGKPYTIKFEQDSYTVEKGKSIEVKVIVTANGDNELPADIQSKITLETRIEKVNGRDVAIITKGRGFSITGENIGKTILKASLEGAESIECPVEVIEAKFDIPAGAKVAFQYDDEIISELTFGFYDSAKWVSIVFVNDKNEVLEIEGVSSDDFTVDIPKVKNADGNEQDLIKTGFNGWEPNGVKGSGTLKATFTKNPDYKGEIKVTVK